MPPTNLGLVTRLPASRAEVTLGDWLDDNYRRSEGADLCNDEPLKPRRRVRDWDWPLIVCTLFIGGSLVALIERWIG